MKDNFLIDLEKEINSLENKISNVSFFNLKMRIMRAFFKTGIGINYAFPFILSLLILFNGANMLDKTPFIYDKICKEMDCDHFYNYEFITEDNKNIVLHSTSWDLNESGFYEREVTYYKYNEFDFSIDFYELDSMFDLVKSYKIVKEELNEYDEIFKTETVILYHDDSLDVISNETFFSNFSTTILFFFFSYIMGCGFNSVGNKFFGTYIVDKLRNGVLKFRTISSREVSELQRLLELKKENYDLFFNCDNVKGYTLKR